MKKIFGVVILTMFLVLSYAIINENSKKGSLANSLEDGLNKSYKLNKDNKSYKLIKSKDFSDNNIPNESIIMAAENDFFKVVVENVDEKYLNSKDYKIVSSDIYVINKTDKEIFVSFKYSNCDYGLSLFMLPDTKDTREIKGQVPGDTSINDMYLDVVVKNKDNDVLLNHSFELIDE